MKVNFSLILCILASIVLFTTARSQTKMASDTMGQFYFQKSLDLAKDFQLEEARLYADSALVEFQASGDENLIAKYGYAIAMIDWKRGAYEACREKLSEYLPIVRSTNDSAMIAVTLYHLSLVEETLGHAERAIEQQLESIALYLALENDEELFNGFNHMGQIHRRMNQYEEAQKYYDEALELALKTPKTEDDAVLYNNMGNLQGQQGHFDGAIEYYRKAEIIDSIEGDTEGLSYVAENYGNLYGRNGRIPEAQEFFLKALALRKKLEGSLEIGRIYQKVGSVYNLMGQHDKALSSMDSAMHYASQSGALEVQKNIALASAMVYEKIGDYSRAYHQMEIHKELQDSFLNKSIAEKVATLNATFDTERKEKEIELLNAEREIADAKLKSTQRQMLLSIIGLILFAILSAFIYRLWQRTKIQNKIIEKSLDEKEILIREIHHRVKNNLQFISSLLGLQSEHVSDDKALGALQEGQDRVQSMALIHQNLYQEENLTGVEVKEYFVKLIRNLFDSYNIRQGAIDLKLDISPLNLDVDTVIPIGLIVNELISNSLKYAFQSGNKGIISVSLKEANSQLILRVADNGNGIPDSAIDTLGDSFGYRLIHVLRDQLHATLEINNERGTQVSMLIKKYVLAA